MKVRVAALGGGALLVALLAPTDANAQQFPGTSSVLNSPETRNLMATLGYAPNDYCGFYHFLSTSRPGQFSDDLLRALLPMCVPWTAPEYPGGSNSQTDPDDPGETGSGSTGGTGSGTTDPGGTGSGGSSGSGTTGGGGTGTWTGGGGGFEDPGSGGGNVEDPGSAGEEDPFGTGSAMATPEPLSLILLGTGLAGIGGARMVRRRRSKLED